MIRSSLPCHIAEGETGDTTGAQGYRGEACGLPPATARGVVKSLLLEVFKNCVDVALRVVVSGHGGDALMVGLDDLKCSFPTSMIPSRGESTPTEYRGKSF